MTRTVLALAFLAACTWSPASRAETINCTEITSLPATLTSQGVYCLKHDVTTAMTSGDAITIAANNITIDCNGYKVGGLAAGPMTEAKGIVALNKLNATVRNCSIRGFATGLHLSGGGHLVESNRFDGNTKYGMNVFGDGHVVRGNSLFDTGGDTSGAAIAIAVSNGSVDVIGNLVSGVHALGNSTGIYAYLITASTIEGNRVREVATAAGLASAVSLWGPSTRLSIRDNKLFGMDAGTGITCGAGGNVTSGNQVLGFLTGWTDCVDGGGNTVINGT